LKFILQRPERAHFGQSVAFNHKRVILTEAAAGARTAGFGSVRHAR
jgi:hypothetical protein